ncbi:MAG: NAD-dependent epimerase/dehydratase family protein [Verrucomicrobiales bacterium]
MEPKSLLKRVLVAGCGYIGELLCDRLHESGWEVVALTHSKESAERLGAVKPYKVSAVSISDAEAVAEFAADQEVFDVAVHCAASGRGEGTEGYLQVYRDGCRHLVDILKPGRVIYTSSTSVYPHADGEIVDEATTASPTTATARILRESEDIVLHANGIVLRLAGLYGPGRSVLLRNFLEGKASIDFREQPPVTLDGRWINQVHRTDVVSALVHVLDKHTELAGEIFNVSDSRPMTQRAVYRAMSRRFDKPEPPTLAANLSTKKRGWTNKRVSNLKLQGTGWHPFYSCYLDALEHDMSLVPSILKQVTQPTPAPSFPYEDFVFVFDKDGVLFNSEPVKLAAFESLFEGFPEHYDAICTFNRSNVGAPRPDKLEFIFTHIFNLERSEVPAKVEEYLERAAKLVTRVLPNAPVTKGVKDFILGATCKKYVCSAAPQEEVHEHLEHHRMLDFFDDVFAHPHRKAEVLRDLRETSGKKVVFWGDTIRDYQASLEAGVLFIGVERYDKADVFVGLEVPVIANFASGGGLGGLVVPG